MAQGKGENWLVWGVLALMVTMGLAALLVAPGGPGGPGTPPQNRAPIPRISPTDVSVTLGDTVDFEGANSSDPDGTVRAFAWDFGDGYTATGAIVSHQYEITGAFKVKLEVTDDKGAKNSTTTNVWVNLDQAVGGTATRNLVSGSLPSATAFPVDPNATRVNVLLELNTSSLAGARAVITLLDPNAAVVYTTNLTLSFGQLPSPVSFSVPEDNLTVEGHWSLKVEADYVLPPPGQPSATVFYSGTVQVSYKP